MVKELSFLCLLTATRDPFGWRARHHEAEHTKLMNTGGTQKVRVKYYQYKHYERKKPLTIQYIRDIYYTLVRNRSTSTEY
jgi:hypothetical protein